MRLFSGCCSCCCFSRGVVHTSAAAKRLSRETIRAPGFSMFKYRDCFFGAGCTFSSSQALSSCSSLSSLGLAIFVKPLECSCALLRFACFRFACFVIISLDASRRQERAKAYDSEETGTPDSCSSAIVLSKTAASTRMHARTHSLS